MSKNIGDEIKRLRELTGFTQAELAEELKVSKSVISAYENGTRYPSYKVLERLNRVLGLDISGNNDYKFMVDITELTPKQRDVIVMTINEFKKINEIHTQSSNIKGKKEN